MVSNLPAIESTSQPPRPRRGLSRGVVGVAGMTLWLFTTSLTALADTRASLARDRIFANESVRLIVETDAADPPQALDLRALEENFDILSNSSSHNISIVDHQQTSARQWEIELAPKTVGVISIPALQVGAERTAPLSLTVLPADEPNTTAEQDVFIEVEYAPRQPYVQQQLVLTVYLYIGVDIISATLSEPAHPDVIVHRLGEDRQYDKVVANRNYRVLERQYALFPQKSGRLRLEPIRFAGRVQRRNTASVLDSFFNRGTQLTARGPQLDLEIQPPNPQFSGRAWLPAKRVQIDQLTPAATAEPYQVEVGQPFNLQIQLQALGLTAAQLPEISLDDAAEYKVYTDQSTTDSQTELGDIIGVRKQSLALIPNRAGSLQLPSINVSWWDTTENRQRTATLPGSRLTVTAAPPPVQPPAGEAEVAQPNAPGPTRPATDSAQNIWRGISAALFILWLTTAAALWQFGLRGKRRPTPTNPNPRPQQAQHALQRACRHNQAAEARHALLQWAAATWPTAPLPTLSDIAARVHPVGPTDLSTQLQHLDAALYAASPNQPQWQGAPLWQALKPFMTAARIEPRKIEHGRMALYPG